MGELTDAPDGCDEDRIADKSDRGTDSRDHGGEIGSYVQALQGKDGPLPLLVGLARIVGGECGRTTCR